VVTIIAVVTCNCGGGRWLQLLVVVVVVEVEVAVSAVMTIFYCVNFLLPCLHIEPLIKAFVFLSSSFFLFHNSPDRARGGTHTNQGARESACMFARSALTTARISAHLCVYPC